MPGLLRVDGVGKIDGKLQGLRAVEHNRLAMTLAPATSPFCSGGARKAPIPSLPNPTRPAVAIMPLGMAGFAPSLKKQPNSPTLPFPPSLMIVSMIVPMIDWVEPIIPPLGVSLFYSKILRHYPIINTTLPFPIM